MGHCCPTCSVTGPTPTVSPSFLLAQAIFEPSLFSLWIPLHSINTVNLHLSAYEDGTECSETSAYKIQTPGNYPEESIQRLQHCPKQRYFTLILTNFGDQRFDLITVLLSQLWVIFVGSWQDYQVSYVNSCGVKMVCCACFYLVLHFLKWGCTALPTVRIMFSTFTGPLLSITLPSKADDIVNNSVRFKRHLSRDNLVSRWYLVMFCGLHHLLWNYHYLLIFHFDEPICRQSWGNLHWNVT